MPVLLSSATEKSGIAEIWKQIENFKTTTTQNGYWEQNRKEQQKQWMLEFIEDQLKSYFFLHSKVQELWKKLEKEVVQGSISPYQAAKELLEVYHQKS